MSRLVSAYLPECSYHWVFSLDLWAVGQGSAASACTFLCPTWETSSSTGPDAHVWEQPGHMPHPCHRECWEEERCLPGLCTGRPHFLKAPREVLSQLWMGLKSCLAAREWLAFTGLDITPEVLLRKILPAGQELRAAMPWKGPHILALLPCALPWPWSVEEGQDPSSSPILLALKRNPEMESRQGQVNSLCPTSLLSLSHVDLSSRDSP